MTKKVKPSDKGKGKPKKVMPFDKKKNKTHRVITKQKDKPNKSKIPGIRHITKHIQREYVVVIGIICLFIAGIWIFNSLTMPEQSKVEIVNSEANLGLFERVEINVHIKNSGSNPQSVTVFAEVQSGSDTYRNSKAFIIPANSLGVYTLYVDIGWGGGISSYNVWLE